jgi:hypothetical protein
LQIPGRGFFSYQRGKLDHTLTWTKVKDRGWYKQWHLSKRLLRKRIFPAIHVRNGGFRNTNCPQSVTPIACMITPTPAAANASRLHSGVSWPDHDQMRKPSVW